MVFDLPKIIIVADGKIEDVRFTYNETKENLRQLSIKKKDDRYKFHQNVIGSDRFFEILYSLSTKLYNDGYDLENKFPDYTIYA